MPLSEPIPQLSVVVPARNESENLRDLVEEIERSVADAGLDYEIVIVDDGSTDDTRETLGGLLARRPRLRAVAIAAPGSGQSAAFHVGFRIARAELVATLDADGQNDPAEIARMVEEMRAANADLIQGDRTDARCDTFVRRIGSDVGRTVRRCLLGDRVRDTGCSLRVMKRDVALCLPLEYRGMHRFIPFTARALGYHVVETPVGHRPRRAGSSKYGIWDRALPGLVDCLVVRWMRRRHRSVVTMPIEAPRPAPEPAVRIEVAAALRAEPEKATR